MIHIITYGGNSFWEVLYTKALRKQDCIGVQIFAVRFTKHKIKFVCHYIYHVGKYMYKVRVDVDPMWPRVLLEMAQALYQI